MSNITINVCTSGGGVPRRAPAGGRKWKAKRFRKKMPHLEESGPQDGTRKYSSHRTGQAGRGQAPPRANGASGKRWSRSARFPGSPAGAPRCGPTPPTSTHSLPALAATTNNKGGHERPKGPANTRSSTLGPRASAASSHGTAAAPTSAGIPAKCLALDCEMVGAGPKGSISQLARCSIVSYEGDVVYDKFIKPPVPVTDYRTRWSGVRRSDLFNATPYSEARREILRLLMGKVVIGHAVHNDFKVLCYSHPSALTRDTSRIPLLNLKAGFAIDERASLKRLTKAIFNRDIQTGRKGHSSVEDARATMELYRVVEEEWERQLAFKSLAT